MGISIWGSFLKESAKTLYRAKIALQLSFTLWVILSIFVFYAISETTAKMWGTLLLLCMVIIFTPFLPDGTGYEDLKSE
jgi:hypothetical protein